MATFYKLNSATVGAGGAASVTFSSIPQTYTDLVVKVSARSSRASDEDGLAIGLNGTGSTSWLFLSGNGSSASAGTSASLGFGGAFVGRIPATNATANTFGNAEIYVSNYAAAKTKSSFVDAATENNASTAYISILGNYYSSTTAVTSIIVLASNANLVQNSTITLYGIRNS
jgi:hypothetical protein